MNDEIKEYTTPSGKVRYRFTVYIGKDEATGNSKQIRKQGYKTKEEAEQAFLEYKLKVVNGDYKKEKQGHVKFSKFIAEWLPMYKPTVKESTYATTLRLIDNHIKKDLGNLYLDKISVERCQKIAVKWSEVSPKVFKRYVTYTAKILDYAVHLELIPSNPMKKIIMPKRKIEAKEFTNFYTKDELDKYLFWAKDYSFKAFCFFRLMSFTGMRKGEVLALRWSDINFNNGTLRVERTVTKGINERLLISTPKTPHSIRSIPVDQQTLKYLLEWKKAQRGDIIQIGGNALDAEQLIFSNSLNKPCDPYIITKWNKAITDRHHLRRITIHGFRHTHASLLFEAGVSMEEVKERLGHSTIKTTMDIYTHVTKAKKKETAQTFAKFMEA